MKTLLLIPFSIWFLLFFFPSLICQNDWLFKWFRWAYIDIVTLSAWTFTHSVFNCWTLQWLQSLECLTFVKCEHVLFLWKKKKEIRTCDFIEYKHLLISHAHMTKPVGLFTNLCFVGTLRRTPSWKVNKWKVINF